MLGASLFTCLRKDIEQLTEKAARMTTDKQQLLFQRKKKVQTCKRDDSGWREKNILAVLKNLELHRKMNRAAIHAFCQRKSYRVSDGIMSQWV